MRMASAMTKALETQNTHKRGGKKKKKNPNANVENVGGRWQQKGHRPLSLGLQQIFLPIFYAFIPLCSIVIKFGM